MVSFKLENESGKVVDINDGINYIVVPPVEGLSPPPATLFMSKSPNRKGSKHNGSTLDDRNILITIKFLGEIEQNRNALYEWIDTAQYVKIYYRNETKNVYCEGYVQECPIDFYSDNETVTVSIVCGDIYFKDLQEIAADISTLLKQFTFPFAIDSKGIPFSTLRQDNTTNVFNAGAETGVKITVKCTDILKNPILFDANDTTRRFKLNYTFPAGWVIEIDTESSPKTCKAIKPDGTVLNLMRYIAGAPTWFTLKKGNNRFGYSAESGAATAEITIGFTNKYLGV